VAYCDNCRYFFPVPENTDDYMPGKADCIREEVDHKGSFWLSKPVVNRNIADNCPYFIPRFIVET